jgi:hypothetical protein
VPFRVHHAFQSLKRSLKQSTLLEDLLILPRSRSSLMLTTGVYTNHSALGWAEDRPEGSLVRRYYNRCPPDKCSPVKLRTMHRSGH